MNLKKGDPAPYFKAKNQKGEEISLDHFKGKKLVLYFYPKDHTPGCTTQACNIRDNYTALLAGGYAVIGISPDTEKRHENFIGKHQLPFDLLADTTHQIATDYGVWAEKSMFGKKYMGIVRTTFLIDEKGMISRIIEKVDTGNHTEQILG
jgi:peroxiredoxin Q/BCP